MAENVLELYSSTLQADNFFPIFIALRSDHCHRVQQMPLALQVVLALAAANNENQEISWCH